jgi:hypothetical protein
MRRSPVLGLLATALAGGTAAAPAAVAAPRLVSLPAVTRTVAVPAAVQRTDCATTQLIGRPGVAATSFAVGQPLSLAVRLAAPAGSDWDLAVFDRASGRRIGGSSGFGATELVTGLATVGQTLDVQACRVAGAARSATITYLSTALPAGSQSARAAQGGRSGTRAAPRALAGASNLPTGRTAYRVLEDYQSELKKLAAANPAIVRPLTLPVKTFQGRDTMGVEISSDVTRTDDQKPFAFVMGVHHAREWPSGEIVMEYAHYLVQQFGTDPEVTNLLKHVRVVVVPIINSDGFVASRSDPSFADQSGDPGGAPSTGESAAGGGTLAYRRKNCNGAIPDPSAPCEFQVGVDPNRNYGFGWGGPGASTMPNSQSYRGTGPFSEPETQAVHQFSQNRAINSLVTVHNFASLVLRPPGLHTQGKAPDEDRLKALGDAMANDTGYTSQYGWQLYDTSGTTEDWNYGAAGTFGYTIELGPAQDDEGGFHIDYQRGVIDQWNGLGIRKGRGMRRALLRISEEAANRPDFSTVVGRAPAGRILRLHKSFITETSPVCTGDSLADVNSPALDPFDCLAPGAVQTFPDKVDYTTKISASGSYGWIVPPSTRPFVGKAGKTEAYTMTCEDTAGKVYETQAVTIGRGETRTIDFACGASVPTTGSYSGPTDKLAPRSRAKVRASRVSIAVSGIAIDRAPAGLTPRVAKVLVTIGRHVGKQCRLLRTDGSFTKPAGCTGNAPFGVARTTGLGPRVAWNYRIGAKLPAGRYFAHSRSLDASGNRERARVARNTVEFRIG